MPTPAGRWWASSGSSPALSCSDCSRRCSHTTRQRPRPGAARRRPRLRSPRAAGLWSRPQRLPLPARDGDQTGRAAVVVPGGAVVALDAERLLRRRSRWAHRARSPFATVSSGWTRTRRRSCGCPRVRARSSRSRPEPPPPTLRPGLDRCGSRTGGRWKVHSSSARLRQLSPGSTRPPAPNARMSRCRGAAVRSRISSRTTWR
jgi:hypothetical protein